jgi:pantoate--beta-alanine ligase
MQQVRNVKAMQRWALGMKKNGTPVALVPTMGYLHLGHTSLIQRARRKVGNEGKIVVSIYVNPTQFGPNEDFGAYPRDLKRDLDICRKEGVDVVFLPDDASMYPGKDSGHFSTYVEESQLSQSMEGGTRPTHFKGVTTIVTKLFMLTLPEFAVFGAKDYQQSAIIRRMTKDLNLPVRIIVAPTVREPDGLAMSSRNAYLTPEQRAQATILIDILKAAKRKVQASSSQTGLKTVTLKKQLEQAIQRCPLARLDYIAFFDPDTLEPLSTVRQGSHMALAVYFGTTRLIDNIRL